MMATFSKSFASIGGVVAGARVGAPLPAAPRAPAIFSASMPPAPVATVLAALEVMEAEPERRETTLAERPLSARRGCRSLGFDTGGARRPSSRW